MVVPKRWRGAFFGHDATWCFMGHMYIYIYILFVSSAQHRSYILDHNYMDHITISSANMVSSMWCWHVLTWFVPTEIGLRLVSHRWRTSSSRLYAKAFTQTMNNHGIHQLSHNSTMLRHHSNPRYFFPLFSCLPGSWTKRTSNLNMHARSQHQKIE